MFAKSVDEFCLRRIGLTPSSNRLTLGAKLTATARGRYGYSTNPRDELPPKRMMCTCSRQRFISRTIDTLSFRLRSGRSSPRVECDRAARAAAICLRDVFSHDVLWLDALLRATTA